MPDDSPATPPPPRLSGLNPSALLRIGLTGQAADSALELPGYVLLGSLGSGGMGEVFRARQESLDREVAVKVLRGELATEGWLPERFEQEARTMATLRHPHVVTVHDCLRLDDGRVAIVMEFIGGGTLRARLTPGGLPLAQALGWAREIAEGLHAAHTAGVVHRDVKPENVLLDESGAARVGDFGLAFSGRPEATRYTLSGTALGTIGYMAPEQLRDGAVDARADVFSFGVVLYEMLTGRLPQGAFRPARELRRDVPAALDALILAMLRPEPEARPADFTVVRAQLEAIAARPNDPVFTRRRVLAAGAAAGAVSAAWWFTRPRGEAPTVPAEKEWQRVAWPGDPASVAIKGGWQRDGTTLLSDQRVCILPLAERLPDSWAIRTRFTRLEGIHSLAIFFRTLEGMGTFTLASWSKNLGGVQVVGGRTIERANAFVFALENGRAYEWTVEYRAGRTRIWIDGELMQERDITGQPLNVAQPWEWVPDPDSPALLIGSWQCPVRWEWMELRELDAR